MRTVLALLLFVAFVYGDRSTINGRTISDRFCAMSDSGTCDFLDYGLWLVKFVAGPTVLFLICFFFAPIFLCGRCCCKCCGGTKAGNGVCCSDPINFGGYSKTAIIVAKVSALLMLALAIVACGFAYNANQNVTTSVSNLTSGIISQGQRVVDTASDVSTRLMALNYTRNTGEQMQPALAQANVILNDARRYQGDVMNYDSYRRYAMICVFAVPTFLLLLGTAFGMFNCKRGSIAFAMFVMFLASLVWLTVTVHLALNLVLSDACDMATAITNGEGSAGQIYIDALFACQQFDSFVQVVNSGIDEAEEAACESLKQLCDDPNITGCPTSACDNTTLPSFKQATIDVGGNPITIEQCAVYCPDTYRTMAEQLVNGIDVLTAYVGIYQNDIVPLVNCGFFIDLFTSVKNAVCVVMDNGFYGLWVWGVVLGAALVFGTFALIRGQKRFIGLDKAGYNDYDAIIDSVENKYYSTDYYPTPSAGNGGPPAYDTLKSSWRASGTYAPPPAAPREMNTMHTGRERFGASGYQTYPQSPQWGSAKY